MTFGWWTLIVLDFLMICLIAEKCFSCCGRCRWFWLIQIIQMLEVPVLLENHISFRLWFRLDIFNLLLDFLSFFLLECMPVAAVFYFIHFALKIHTYTGIDGMADFSWRFPFWLDVWLNDIAILSILLWYGLAAHFRKRGFNLCTMKSLKSLGIEWRRGIKSMSR